VDAVTALASVLAALPPAMAEDIERRGAAGQLDADERAWLNVQVRDAEQRPLAYARLWDRDLPRTSQRRAAHAALEKGKRRCFILGGNRSGKSTVAAQVGVALMLGRDHPITQAWCRANGVDPLLIPKGPGRVYAVALDSGDSIQYNRPEWARWLGPRAKWHNREGQGDAWADLDGGRVVFKSCDQGRDGMQGTNIRAALCDEEPPLDVVNELEMRLVDQRGRLIISATPLQGWTSLLTQYVKSPPADTGVQWLWGEDNPHVPTQELEARLANFGAHEQAARRRGEIAALEGRVYEAWSRSVHVWHGEPLPEWVRYMAIDWGTSVPSALGLLAYDAGQDVIYLVDLVYRAQMTIGQRADAIRELEAKWCPLVPAPTREDPKATAPGECEMRWADPEDASTNRTITLEHGIMLTSAVKDVRLGINLVAARLAPDALGRPHLYIHARCGPALSEMDSYVWANVERQQVKKANDHAVDMIRYGCMGIARQAGLLASLRASGQDAGLPAPDPTPDRHLRLLESLRAA
jgi:phage terminase large subunit-like protein